MSELKRKRVFSEWHRARSRAAARSRREQERKLFCELVEELPLSPGLNGFIDKTSIVRLALSYLRLRTLIHKSMPTMYSSSLWESTFSFFYPSGCEETFLDSALGGFLLMVSNSGQVIYTTDAIRIHTGISKMDLIGQSLFPYMHPCDVKDVRELLSKRAATETDQQYDLVIRMRFTQGRLANMKSTSWKAMQCSGIRTNPVHYDFGCLLLLCQPLPDLGKCTSDAWLSRTAFLSRHTLDMRFSYCQSSVTELLGYTETELLGQSVYQYYHTLDCQRIRRSHLHLFSKGQASTGTYRLLVKYGGYVWMETNASLVYNSETGQPQSITCVNYILSEAEQRETAFSLEQADSVQHCHKSGPITAFATTKRNGGSPTTPSQKPGTNDRHKVHLSVAHMETMLEWDSAQSSPELFQDLFEDDLDTLAPYIPMDGEDFLLSPITGTSEEKTATLYTFGGCDSHYPNLQHMSHSDLKQLEPSLTKHKPFHPVCLPSQGHWNSMAEEKQEGQRQKRSDGHSESSLYQQYDWIGGTPITSPGMKMRGNPSSDPLCKAYDTGWWNHDWRKGSGGSDPLGSLPWRSECTSVSGHPRLQQNSHSGCFDKDHAWLEPAESILPELTRLECEVNAPLAPTSCLLQGAELLSVLDQAVTSSLTPGVLGCINGKLT